MYWVFVWLYKDSELKAVAVQSLGLAVGFAAWEVNGKFAGNLKWGLIKIMGPFWSPRL